MGGVGEDRAEYKDAPWGLIADLARSEKNTGIAAGDTYSSIENLLGSDYGDILRGNGGANKIWGSSGMDVLVGRGGSDTLSGGGGRDTFVYNAVSDSRPSAADTITDFRHGTDKIDFTNIAGINASGGAPQFQGEITGGGNLTLNPHSVAYLEIGENTHVLVNAGSTAETVTAMDTGNADMMIVLVGVHLGLSAGDFLHL